MALALLETMGRRITSITEKDVSTTAYEDFEIEIGAGNGIEFPISVVQSPAGETRQMMIFPLSELQLENILIKLEKALLRSGGSRRTALTPDEEAVREFGTMLFEALFAGEVRNLYDVSREQARHIEKGLRIKLRINDPMLAALPWEYLFDPRHERYIGLSSRTPIVRYLELPHPPRPLAAPTPLRILGMISNPDGLEPLDIEREKMRMERAIEQLRLQGFVELVWIEGETWQDLQRAMYAGPWHIFHFIGHGYFDQNEDEGFIALADQDQQVRPLSATKLARLLSDHASLRLVLLNTCEGGRAGNRTLFSSAASILVQRGVPAVLAMQYEITDQAAIECARSFYQALAYGLPVDAAVAEARKGISLHVNNSLEWGVPVLYMRTNDGLLFDIAQSEIDWLSTNARAAQESEPVGEHRSLDERTSSAQAREDALGSRTQNLPTEKHPDLGTASVANTRLGTKEVVGSEKVSQEKACQEQGEERRTPLRKPRFGSVRTALGLSLAAGWLAGIGIYWTSLSIFGNDAPWTAGLAWCVSSIVQFLFARKLISGGGQWLLSSSASWSLGWLIGWSLNLDTTLVLFGDILWPISGAIIFGVGATLISALQEEGVEARIVFSATGAVFGAVLGYGFWKLLLPSLWTMIAFIIAIYALVGLTIAMLHLRLFKAQINKAQIGWGKKVLIILISGALVGGLSWVIVSTVAWQSGLSASRIKWTTLVHIILSGNLAGAFAGLQIAVALRTVLRNRWAAEMALIGAGLWSVLGGVLPGLLTGIFTLVPPEVVGSVLVLLPILIWLAFFEKDALVAQIGGKDRALAVDAVRLLRIRGWFSETLFRGANLEETDLSGLDLSYADLTGTNLEGTDLSNSDLSNTILIGANLIGSDLNSANLTHAVLQKANLQGVDLRGALLEKTVLYNAIYDDGTLWPETFDYLISGALGPSAYLHGSLLSGVQLDRLDLYCADLSNADLSNATLVGTNLGQANLQGADLRGADLSKARLKGSILLDARYDDETKWPTGIDPKAEGAINVTG